MKVKAVQPTQSDTTATDMAAPRIRLGKISLITTQRAFELNSQSIKAADQSLQVISNLRRF